MWRAGETGARGAGALPPPSLLWGGRARREGAGGKDGRERPIRLPRPFVVERRHLGGDPDVTGADVDAQHLADQSLAVSGAVRQRGIEERDALIHGRPPPRYEKPSPPDPRPRAAPPEPWRRRRPATCRRRAPSRRSRSR